MSGNNFILLDTNIVIDIFKGDRKLAKHVDEFQKTYITPIVLGELDRRFRYREQCALND